MSSLTVLNKAAQPAGPEPSQTIDQTACPLCKSGTAREFFRDKHRTYLRCQACQLLFVPSSQHLSPDQEKSRYDLHRNSSADAGYRLFLSRMLLPLLHRLPSGCSGLDFGCGPEPLLAAMFEEAGYPMMTFDYFYQNNPAALTQQYDFITATEVVEHLHDPERVLDRLWTCLKPGGYLGLMTKFAAEPGSFSRWYYKNDRTHVCFFSPPTFTWIAARWHAELSFHHGDVALFRKIADFVAPNALPVP